MNLAEGHSRSLSPHCWKRRVRLALQSASVPYTEQNSSPEGLISLIIDATRICHTPNFARPSPPRARSSPRPARSSHTPASRARRAARLNDVMAEGRAQLKELSKDALSTLDWQTEAHNIHHPIAVVLYYGDQKPSVPRTAEVFRRDHIPQ